MSYQSENKECQCAAKHLSKTWTVQGVAYLEITPKSSLNHYHLSFANKVLYLRYRSISVIICFFLLHADPLHF